MLVLVLVLMRILVKLESTGAGADASTCGVSTVLSGSRVVGGFYNFISLLLDFINLFWQP